MRCIPLEPTDQAQIKLSEDNFLFPHPTDVPDSDVGDTFMDDHWEA